MTETKHHVLHVTIDPKYPEDREYSVTCPHDSKDLSRSCVMWWECGRTCQSQYEELSDSGEDGPCIESVDGRHRTGVVVGELAHPSTDCFPAHSDHMQDAASDLDLPPGDYPIDFDVEDFEYVSFYVVEAGAA